MAKTYEYGIDFWTSQKTENVLVILRARSVLKSVAWNLLSYLE